MRLRSFGSRAPLRGRRTGWFEDGDTFGRLTDRMMIHSTGGKTYDTSDGSEQPHAASTRPAANVHPADRWADDGAPARSAPAAAPASRRKPLWSVLTLRRLAELLRPKPAVAEAPTESQGAIDAGVKPAQEREAAQAAALKEYYRNAWEHT